MAVEVGRRAWRGAVPLHLAFPFLLSSMEDCNFLHRPRSFPTVLSVSCDHRPARSVAGLQFWCPHVMVLPPIAEIRLHPTGLIP